MTFFYGFVFGMVSGIYASQNYDLPNIKHWSMRCLALLKTLEKDKTNKPPK
jgi:hypothetical protein